MPRELVHWYVLDQALNRLGIGLTKEAHACAYLGALVHDIPYYHKFGKGNFQLMGNYLHGLENADTLQPIRELSAKINSTNREAIFPLIIGMLSHIATDIEFHPLVFYFTGDYYHPNPVDRNNAQIRHRALETYLDYWMSKSGAQQLSELTLPTIIRGVDRNLNAILDVLSILKFENLKGTEDYREQWQNSISCMTICQAAFVNRYLGFLVNCGRKFNIAICRNYESLFQYRRRFILPMFTGKINYNNPVSGQESSTTLVELLERSVDQTVKLIECFNNNKLNSISTGSLNYGIFGAAPTAAHIFSDRLEEM